MPFRFIDYETCSAAPLENVGSYVYSEDPSTRVLMVGTALEFEPPSIAPNVRAVYRPGETIISWGSFDRLIALNVEKFVHKDWIDASALALYVGLPRGLKDFCLSVGIEATKDPRGTRLINTYSKNPDRVLEGDDLKAFEEYCLQDVVLLQKAWKVLAPLYPEWKRTQEQNYWHVEAMNAKGVPIDTAAVAEAISQIRRQETRLVEEFGQLTNGLKPSQTEQVRLFLGLDDVTRATLQTARFDDPIKARVAEIRLQISNATAKKLQPMLDMAGSKGRARGCFTNNGAHTGRGSSQNIQFQNLKRSKPDPEYFAKLRAGIETEDPLGDAQKNIRGFICPEPRNALVVADYAQVEVRVLAWISGDPELLSIFARGADPYREYGARMLHKKPEDITDRERQISKIALLGSGYGAGGPALSKQSPAYGVTLTEKEAKKLVREFRGTFCVVPCLWDAVHWATLNRVKGTESTPVTIGRSTWSMNKSGTALICELPSGRKMRYMKPQIDKVSMRKRDENGKEYFEATAAVTYRSRYARKTLWGGLLTENLCQAITSDLKMDAIREFGGLAIAEVHDEIVLEVPAKEAEFYRDRLIKVMENPKPWFENAKGLIKAEASIMERYGK